MYITRVAAREGSPNQEEEAGFGFVGCPFCTEEYTYNMPIEYIILRKGRGIYGGWRIGKWEVKWD
jgi:hypothetical protein